MASRAATTGCRLWSVRMTYHRRRGHCRGCGVLLGRECSENFGGSAILVVRRTLTSSRGEYLRVVGIHSDG